MKDIHFAAAVYGLMGAVFSLYGARAVLRGRARHERVERDGGSLFVGKRFMEVGYWVIGPVVAALDGLGVTPNGVTAFSLLPALGAGMAVAAGWFGLGCLLAALASFADIVDGLLARRQGISSDAGEALDALADRYAEFFFVVGLLFHYRGSPPLFTLSALVLVGGYMVSYATVKAEALGVAAPRGAMRRAERAVYLFLGAGFTPLAQLLAGPTRPLAVRELPIVFAIVVVAVVSNASAARRTRAIMTSVRQREAAQRKGARPADAPAQADAAF